MNTEASRGQASSLDLTFSYSRLHRHIVQRHAMGLEPVYEIVPLRMLREHVLAGLIACLFYHLILDQSS